MKEFIEIAENACQCEHSCHIQDNPIDPTGHSTHHFMEVCGSQNVRTLYGWFFLCQQCVDNCHSISKKG